MLYKSFTSRDFRVGSKIRHSTAGRSLRYRCHEAIILRLILKLENLTCASIYEVESSVLAL
mgnify:CR=1 FL=1